MHVREGGVDEERRLPVAPADIVGSDNFKNHDGSNNDILEQPVNLTTISARYASRAARYITQPRQAPFFIYAAFAHMHVPQAFEPQWRHTSTRKTVFGDALREADAAVGELAPRSILLGSGLQSPAIFQTAILS